MYGSLAFRSLVKEDDDDVGLLFQSIMAASWMRLTNL